MPAQCRPARPACRARFGFTLQHPTDRQNVRACNPARVATAVIRAP